MMLNNVFNVEPSHKTFFTKWSGVWLSRGSYRVYVTIMGGQHGRYGVYDAYF